MKVSIKQLKEQVEKFKSLYKSVCEANRKHEQTINDLQGRLATAVGNLSNAQKAVDINKDLLRRTSEEHNKKEVELVDLLTKLKAKLREMGYNGNFDNLGNEDN